MGFDMQIELKEHVLIIRLKGEIGHHEANIFRQKWEDYFSKESFEHVVFNMDDVTFMDSSGIGLILGRYKEIVAKGGELVICSVHPNVTRLFTLSGLFKIIRFEENEHFALLSLGVAS